MCTHNINLDKVKVLSYNILLFLLLLSNNKKVRLHRHDYIARKKEMRASI